MNDEVAFSVSQFGEAWRLFCAACPAPMIREGDGVRYLFSGLPIPFFNVGLVTDRHVSRTTLEHHGRQACEWAANAHVPWLFMVTHDALAPGVDADAVLDRCGLIPMLPLTGMRTDRVAATTRVPDGLQIAVAEDDASCSDVFDINSAAYGADLDACKPTFGHRAFWRDHVLSLGRVDGKPAASAAVLDVDGYRYVALVATIPDAQRHGYGEAVMRHALDVAAANGDRPTSLHATDAGRPIYERMGYKTIAAHTAFIEKRFLEGH